VPLCGDDAYDLRVREPESVDSGTARFEQVTGRVGLDWKITTDWMVYGSIAYGEKPGGLQLANVTVLPPASPPEDRFITSTFEPEELTAYELGVKGTTWDGRMRLNMAVFFNDWQEIVLRQLLETEPTSGLPLEQPTAFNVNAGDAEVLGFEAEMNVSLTDYLTGRATVGWQDSELKDAAQDTYEGFPTFAPDGDVSGNKLLRQPEWMLSGSLTYERELGGDWDWYLGGDASYQSGIYVGNDNQGYLPDHTYVNARLGAKSGRYTVELWGRNIFDDGGAIAAFRDIYWANTDNLYEPYFDQGPRPNFDEFVPLRYSVTYPRETTYGLTATMRFGAAAD
jgi:iron complex outermembrane receptor protein